MLQCRTVAVSNCCSAEPVLQCNYFITTGGRGGGGPHLRRVAVGARVEDVDAARAFGRLPVGLVKGRADHHQVATDVEGAAEGRAVEGVGRQQLRLPVARGGVENVGAPRLVEPRRADGDAYVAPAGPRRAWLGLGLGLGLG